MTISQNQLDELAKVIDPDAWALYDDMKVIKTMKPKLREEIVYDSRLLATRIANSGLMASFEWDRNEYIRARSYIKDHTSKRGYCYSVEDGLDGYVMHDPRCQRWPEAAISGTGCIDPPRGR